MMDKQIQCYLCGGKNFDKRPGNVRDRPELEILECVSCGLVFLSSFDHISDLFYVNSEMHGESLLNVDVWLKETAWDDERRFQYLKSVLPNSKLLDFGCGAGGFLSRARDLAATAHGMEPEGRLFSHYQSGGLTVFQNLSDISTGFSTGNGYDIITMFHVLEHIQDPKSILSDLVEILADKGQLIVEVPNADDALLTLYHNEPFSCFTYWSCHLFLFTAKTLKIVFDQMNLKVNYIKQVQRYPLSNHLHWLATGRPVGHQKWHFLDSPELNAAYGNKLAEIGKCDTIIASCSKR